MHPKESEHSRPALFFIPQHHHSGHKQGVSTLPFIAWKNNGDEDLQNLDWVLNPEVHFALHKPNLSLFIKFCGCGATQLRGGRAEWQNQKDSGPQSFPVQFIFGMVEINFHASGGQLQRWLIKSTSTLFQLSRLSGTVLPKFPKEAITSFTPFLSVVP